MTDKQIAVDQPTPPAVQNEAAPNTFSLLQQAVIAGTSPEALEKLVDLQERILAQQAEAAFAAALAAFQAECPPIIRSATGHHGRYADYEQIMRTIQPVLGKHGLSITFDSRSDCPANTICLDCIVRHSAGHSVVTSIPNMPDDTSGKKNPIQSRGSSMQYVRRYGVIEALNLVSTGEVDDDGFGGAAVTITPAEAFELAEEVKKVGADESAFLGYLGVNRYEDIPARDLSRAKAGLEAKRRQGK